MLEIMSGTWSFVAFFSPLSSVIESLAPTGLPVLWAFSKMVQYVYV